mgnify:FL=1
MIDKSDDIANEIIESNNYPEIILSIVEKAENIFKYCNAHSDFGLQSIGYNSIVFGGTNRLIWNIDSFRIDESYCTANFKDKFKELKNSKFYALLREGLVCLFSEKDEYPHLIRVCDDAFFAHTRHDHSEKYIGKHQRLVESKLQNKEWIEVGLEMVLR